MEYKIKCKNCGEIYYSNIRFCKKCGDKLKDFCNEENISFKENNLQANEINKKDNKTYNNKNEIVYTEKNSDIRGSKRYYVKKIILIIVILLIVIVGMKFLIMNLNAKKDSLKKIEKSKDVIFNKDIINDDIEESTTTEKIEEIIEVETTEDKYNNAMDMLEKGEYAKAYKVLKEIRGYSDTEEILKRFGVRYLTQYRFSNYDGYREKTTFVYDEFGNCTEEFWISDIVNMKKTMYSYDENKKLLETKEQFFNEESGHIRTRTYIYDENRNLIKEKIPFEDREIDYMYDDNGNCIQKKERNVESGEDRDFFRYEYDNNNCIREIFSKDYNGWKVEGIKEYFYNHKGNCIQELSRDSEDEVTEINYIYNSMNKLESKHKIIESYAYGNFGDMIKKEEIYDTVYTYDIEGNLINEKYQYETNNDSGWEEKEYDFEGQILTKLKYDDGGVITYTYDDIQYFYKKDDKVIVFDEVSTCNNDDIYGGSWNWYIEKNNHYNMSTGTKLNIVCRNDGLLDITFTDNYGKSMLYTISAVPSAIGPNYEFGGNDSFVYNLINNNETLKIYYYPDVQKLLVETSDQTLNGEYWYLS